MAGAFNKGDPDVTAGATLEGLTSGDTHTLTNTHGHHLLRAWTALMRISRQHYYTEFSP